MSKTTTPREAFDPAYPTPAKVSDPSLSGLTKREHIAAQILAAIIGGGVTSGAQMSAQDGRTAVAAAISLTDELLARISS